MATIKGCKMIAFGTFYECTGDYVKAVNIDIK